MQKLSIQEMNRLTPEAFHQATKLPFVVLLDNVRSQHNIGAVFRTADAFLLEGVYLCGICSCPPNTEIHKTALGAEETVHWQHFDHTLDAIRVLREKGYRIYAVEQAHDSITLEQAREEVETYLALPQETTPTQETAAPNTEKPAEKPNTGKQSIFANNKIFTEDVVEAARQRMHERMKRLNAGIDPIEPTKKTSPAGIAVILGHEVFGVDQAVVDASDACIEIPQYGTKHSLNVSVTAGIVLYTLATAMRNKNNN